MGRSVKFGRNVFLMLCLAIFHPQPTKYHLCYVVLFEFCEPFVSNEILVYIDCETSTSDLFV